MLFLLPPPLLLPQPSLTGSGAKIAIICNVTPASSQSDETWNTLRFADGAKRIKVRLPTVCPASKRHAKQAVCYSVPQLAMQRLHLCCY